MVNDFGFQQQRQIDQALLGMAGGSPSKQQQDMFARLIGSPQANTYANQAIERMGIGSMLNSGPGSSGTTQTGTPGGRMAQPTNPAQNMGGGFTFTPEQFTSLFGGGSRPYDGPGMTAQQGGQGFGGFGMTPDVFAQLWGGPPQVQAQGGREYSGSQGQTYGILNPSEFGFGFGQGVPGGDMVQWLQDAGFPDVNLLQALQQGGVPRQTNVPSSMQQLGGAVMPSPQALQRLGPSGYQFLMGLYATMLGIPEEDLLYGAMQPFRGLASAPQARQTTGFMR